MKRTQIQLDEPTYERLRHRAFEQGRSMSAVARDILSEALGVHRPPRRLTLADFPWIGMGASDDSDLAPVSERHDEALERIWAEELGL